MPNKSNLRKDLTHGLRTVTVIIEGKAWWQLAMLCLQAGSKEWQVVGPVHKYSRPIPRDLLSLAGSYNLTEPAPPAGNWHVSLLGTVHIQTTTHHLSFAFWNNLEFFIGNTLNLHFCFGRTDIFSVCDLPISEHSLHSHSLASMLSLTTTYVLLVHKLVNALRLIAKILNLFLVILNNFVYFLH